MFFEVLIKVISIFFIIFAGAIARRKKFLTDDTASAIASCITSFFYPALIFSSITTNFTLKSLVSNWILPAGTIIIMLTGYCIGSLFIRFIPFDSAKQKNTFLFQCTINNYVFLPLPIIIMFLGNSAAAYVIFSSLGSEISVWTIGVLGLTGNKIEKKSLKNLLSVPMISLIFSILTVLIRDIFLQTIPSNILLKSIAQSISDVISMFGKATVPLALFIAGSRMANLSIQQIKTTQNLWIVFLRLVFIPAFACVLILLLLPVSYESFFVLSTIAIMPAAIASIILSDVYNADTEFASSSVLITHLFSVVTIPAWLTFFMR